MEFGLSVAEF